MGGAASNAAELPLKAQESMVQERFLLQARPSDGWKHYLVQESV